MPLTTCAPKTNLESVEMLDKLAVEDGFHDKPVDAKARFPHAS